MLFVVTQALDESTKWAKNWFFTIAVAGVNLAWHSSAVANDSKAPLTEVFAYVTYSYGLLQRRKKGRD